MNFIPHRTSEPHISISGSQAFNLLVPYVKKRVGDQVKSVALIIVYLLFFQIVVLHVAIAQASIIALGVLLVVLGLAFFIEGLFLGIMPLGESIGAKLPEKSRMPIILLFAFVLGVLTTVAEPAIGMLRAAGLAVKPWDAPLLFLLLNRFPSYLVMAIGAGVGAAVLCGMLRFLYNWSLKPFIIVPVVVLLGFSLLAAHDPNMRSITGMAWDCGGITTGPVTVPLVLALGIGICRVVGSASSGIAGLGVVSLASLYPVLTVMLLGLPFAHAVPHPMSETDFALPANRAAVVGLFGSEERMVGYMLKNGAPSARAALFGGDTGKLAAYCSRLVTDRDLRKKALGPAWGDRAAHEFTKGVVARDVSRGNGAAMVDAVALQPLFTQGTGRSFVNTVFLNFSLAVRAIIPLLLLLVFVMVAILRERPGRSGEIIIGVLFALVGLGLFNVGMELGLARLGGQIGELLPSTIKTIDVPGETSVIRNFDSSLVATAITVDGEKERFFYARQGRHYIQAPYSADRYNAAAREYVYTPKRGPINGKERSFWGYLLFFVFALVMGYAATLAEPALTTLGFKVEELTVGVFRQGQLKQWAAIGVGIGMMFGCVKVLADLPLVYLLVPPYLLAAVFTFFVNEEFTNIAWDCGGVTTGPVTVPLVLAMGLGLCAELGLAEGFGIIALASIWPVLMVLMVSMVKTHERKAALGKMTGDRAAGRTP